MLGDGGWTRCEEAATSASSVCIEVLFAVVLVCGASSSVCVEVLFAVILVCAASSVCVEMLPEVLSV
jgi:hypothetical protein